MILAVLGLLLAQAAGVPPAAPTPTPPEPSGPILDTSLLAEVRRVAERVATLRSTSFSKEPLALRSTEALRQTAVDARAAALVPAGHSAARGRAWADIGLGDAATPSHVIALLAADLPEVSLDAEGKRLLVSAGTLSDSDFVSESDDDPRSTVFLATGVRPDEPLVAHGLVHLLQRQRGAAAAPRDTTTDAALAAAAWAEGEANFLAIRFLFQSMGIGDTIFRHDVDPTLVLDGRLVGVALDALPAVERSLLGFVHQEGFAQVIAMYRSGGWRGVEQAAAVRTSTRDLLHPERAGGTADAPLPVAAAPGPGLRLADEDRVGEQGVIALVSSRTGKDDLALVAGDGWLGDRLQRWEPEGLADPRAGVTVWDSAWSSPDAAREFAYGIGRAIEDGMAGAALVDEVEHRRSWRVSDKIYRLNHQLARVSLRVALASVDERLEPLPTKTKKPIPPPPSVR